MLVEVKKRIKVTLEEAQSEMTVKKLAAKYDHGKLNQLKATYWWQMHLHDIT